MVECNNQPALEFIPVGEVVRSARIYRNLHTIFVVLFRNTSCHHASNYISPLLPLRFLLA